MDRCLSALDDIYGTINMQRSLLLCPSEKQARELFIELENREYPVQLLDRAQDVKLLDARLYVMAVEAFLQGFRDRTLDFLVAEVDVVMTFDVTLYMSLMNTFYALNKDQLATPFYIHL